MSITLKASMWAFVANVVQRGSAILATPIFTRLLTTEEYAQYTLYQSWHDILTIFITLNVFNHATYTAMATYEDDREEFISSAQFVVTILTVAFGGLYLCLYFAKKEIVNFPVKIVILMFVDILFVSSYNLWCAKERYFFRYKTMFFLSLVIGVCGPILGILLTNISENKGYGRIYGVAGVNIIIGAMIYLYNLKKTSILFNLKHIKFILTYCIPLVPHFLSSQILTRFDRIMINGMCGAAQTAVYSLAYSLSSIMLIVNDAILKSLTPWTYQIIREKKDISTLREMVNKMVVLVAVVNLVLILFAPEAITLFSTDEYYQAIYIIPAVSASVFFTFVYFVFVNIEYYYSETKYVGIASILAAILNIVLNYIFIPRYGFIAAGYTTLISYIAYAAGHFLFMRKVCKKYANGIDFYDIKSITLISLVFILICIAIIPLYKYSPARYLILAAIGIGILLNRNTIIDFMKD